jgi:hypothetical protein
MRHAAGFNDLFRQHFTCKVNPTMPGTSVFVLETSVTAADAIDAYVAQLTSPSVAERRDACIALKQAEALPEAAIRGLVDRLEDHERAEVVTIGSDQTSGYEDESVSCRAYDALCVHGPRHHQLIHALSLAGAPFRRAVLLPALRHAPPWIELLDALAGDDAIVRESAAGVTQWALREMPFRYHPYRDTSPTIAESDLAAFSPLAAALLRAAADSQRNVAACAAHHPLRDNFSSLVLPVLLRRGALLLTSLERDAIRARLKDSDQTVRLAASWAHEHLPAD